MIYFVKVIYLSDVGSEEFAVDWFSCYPGYSLLCNDVTLNALLWLTDYLTCRTQFLVVNGQPSTALNVTCGIIP